MYKKLNSARGCLIETNRPKQKGGIDVIVIRLMEGMHWKFWSAAGRQDERANPLVT